MNIRKAANTPDDLVNVVRLGLEFHQASPYRWMDATADTLAELAALLFALGDQAVIFLAFEGAQPVGFIAGAIEKNLLTGQLTAGEIAWWIDPSSRGSIRGGPVLLRRFEEWARERNCYMVKMTAPKGSKVGGYYERLGYFEVETIHAKVLT